MLLLLQILISISLCEVTEYKDEHVDPLIHRAKMIREHPLQKQTRSILDQIYNNLDRTEYENMRKKFMQIVGSSENKYRDILYATKHEVIFLFKEAIEKIPGAQITTNFFHIKEPPPKKDWLRMLSPNEGPITLSSRKDATDFRVSGFSVEFKIDGKVYIMSPSIFGQSTMRLASTNAEKYLQEKNNCFNSTKEQLKKYSKDELCKDFQNIETTKYKVGEDFYTLDNNITSFAVTSDYASSRRTRDVSLTNDVVRNSIYDAVLAEKNYLKNHYYSHDKQYEYTKEQKEKSNAIRREESLYIKTDVQKESGGAR